MEDTLPTSRHSPRSHSHPSNTEAPAPEIFDMDEPNDLIPLGLDIGSLHARVAIGQSTSSSPDIVSNAQGSRYTLALVGTDEGNAEDNATSGQTRYIFGETARRALARNNPATDASSTVRQLARSAAAKDDGAADKAAAGAAFVTHLMNLSCDASAAHPSKLRTVASVSVDSDLDERHGIVSILERGMHDALAARQSAKERKARKKNGSNGEDPSVMAIIADPVAVCIAHGLLENEPGIVDLSATKCETTRPWKNALVVDWGASGLTATHICRTSTNSSMLKIIRYVTDDTCSGMAITSTLAKHCATTFERKNRVSGLLDSKKACFKLNMACESAVRTLSRAPSVTVAVDGLFEGIDMSVPISRPRFDMLMSGILRKAETLLQTFTTSEKVDFDVVLLCGNVCDMPSCVNLIRKKLFPAANAGRGDIPPDEAVAIGCARHAASILSCNIRSKNNGQDADKINLPSISRSAKMCPLTIGICRVENEKENGDLEEIITNNAVALIETGDPLPVNVTRSITCTDGEESWLSNSSVFITQMRGGAVTKSKVIGKVEGIPPEDKSFEITMELSSDGKLALSINGGKLVTL